MTPSVLLLALVSLQNPAPAPFERPAAAATLRHAMAPLVHSLALAVLQDPAPAPIEAPPVPQVQPEAKPELVPGALPADATPQALELWKAVRNATSGTTPQAKVSAFEIGFDARGWEAGGKGEADFNNGRIRFFAPGFVDSALEVKGRRRLRGPKGDWLVDAEGRRVRLSGVDYEQDRAELDQIVHVARTFANLVDAANLRLRSLKTLAAAPFPLPAAMAERAKALAWLELVSPDFAIARSDGKAGTREVRAWIGVDAATKLPRMAVVAEDDKGTLVHESASLIVLDKYKPIDGFQVPFDVQTFQPDLRKSPWQFSEKPKLRLFVTSATLRAPFTAETFDPDVPQRR